MKTIRINFKSTALLIILAMGLQNFTGCSSDDDGKDEIIPKESCEDFECLNGGTAIEDVEMETCRCLCPQGYSGTNCEVKD